MDRTHRLSSDGTDEWSTVVDNYAVCTAASWLSSGLLLGASKRGERHQVPWHRREIRYPFGFRGAF
ncbi:hypothetical protein JMJ77_0007575 [Colletotrichum scovillei]|uniref:Uncharacterized protein n=1 Tax=Colletotrichum scovillei TaxID=1209932 RepID=A0A9P7RET1_9PEZI|nr:hypothetical protein JMJ77_0007575 [Colletotrichum scovillei]KAG7074552.1 hypothetical protein JMJ76_0011029 [Colletotrichum scovillei]KAG7081707.1 hypothetical protein JMJ78_0003823 [Colletotrichum scovillei]